MTTAAARAPVPISRDLRLDFFRGLALVFIFIDHIPDNLLADFTVRNIGFSDATEMFVYISGYTAGLVYMAAMLREGWLFATARILRRVWQLYMAHIALFVIFTAQVAWTASQFDNPEYAEEMNVMSFLHEPHIAIVQALLLSFKPVNLDVLPLYIVLLAGFPVALWLIAHNRIVTVVLSFVLYAAASVFKWNLPGYPPGSEWFFNPVAWQFLFVLGASLGSLGATDSKRLVDMQWGGWMRDRWVMVAALAYLVFSFAVAVSWNFVDENDTSPLPMWLLNVLFPMSKTYMSPWRLLHFLALAYVAMRLFDRTYPFFATRWARPLLYIGESGLQMFCVGVFLSFAAHFVLVEVDNEPLMQFVVNAVGIGIMLAVAALIHWYKATEKGRAAAQRRRAVATAEGVAE
ncbi:MAG TPA: OpgC domain-containing protein [Alphaproteobacteria bacterium]|jgi:hypothetical protein|nr:OpgC domain-containing protein [Alphaproteobacteria bacterium]